MAHLILEFSQEGGFANAENFKAETTAFTL
jgi:hypothetical protein